MGINPVPRYAFVWAIRITLLLIFLPVMYTALHGGPPDFDGEGGEGARTAVWIILPLLLLACVTPTSRATRGETGDPPRLRKAFRRHS